MPQLDTSRDYYADLELPPSADINEIKKQFRKLALLYHPDRNPGKEAEVNSKFQTIQSAHEILSDPELKSKYDVSRPRSRFPTASGVKGNPWSNAGANFPPPPRRNGPTRNPPQSGAQKYRNFTGAAPTAKAHAREDPMEARRNAWHAFEHMRPGSQGKSAYSQANTKQPEVSPTRPPRPVPRTPGQKQRAQAAFGGRKGDESPDSPVSDEPAARPNAAQANNRHTYDPSDEDAHRTARESIPDPLAQFRPHHDSRHSTPYRNSGGEKTNPFDGTSVGRTKSTRDSSRRGQEADPGLAPGSPRHNRSASAPRSPYASDFGESSPNSPSYTKNTFPSRASARYTPPGVANEAEKPYRPSQHTPDTGHGLNGSGSGRQSPNKAQGPSMYEPTDSPPRYSPYFSSFARRAPQPPSSQVYGTGPSLDASCESKYFPSPSGDTASSYSGGGPLTPFERQQGELLKKLINEAYITPRPKRQPTVPLPRSLSSPANGNDSHSFSFPVGDDTFTQRTTPEPNHFTRNSKEDINTSFVEKEGPETWQFNAGGSRQEDRSDAKSSEAGNRPIRQPSAMQPPPRPAKEPLGESQDAAAAGAKFDAQDWSRKIGAQNFAPQPGQSGSVSPSRGSRSNSRKATRSAQPAGAANEESIRNEGIDLSGHRVDEPMATGSPMAMDIDPPAPSATEKTQPKASTARNIPVEPSRPEWRAGDVQGVQEPQQTNGAPKVPPKAHAVGSEDSEEFRASFADLNNVAPFAQQASGLGSLNDLKSNLPFDSQASKRVPIAREKKSNPELSFPAAPQAPPPPPALAVSGIKPNASTWQKYLLDFQNYIQQWDAFNAQVTDHFGARKAQILKARETNGYSFLATQSDNGIQEYLEWVEQDQGVRRKWMAACDEHERRVHDFIAFKRQMK